MNKPRKRGLPGPLGSLKLPFFVLTELHRGGGACIGRRRVNLPAPPPRSGCCPVGIGGGGDDGGEVLKWRRESHHFASVLSVQKTTKTLFCIATQSHSPIVPRHVDFEEECDILLLATWIFIVLIYALYIFLKFMYLKFPIIISLLSKFKKYIFISKNVKNEKLIFLKLFLFFKF